MRRTLLSLILVATALASAPASAAFMRAQPVAQRQIRMDINQLETRIDRAAQRGVVTPAEAASLRRQAMSVQRLYDRYSRGGLDRREAAALTSRIGLVNQQLRMDRGK